MKSFILFLVMVLPEAFAKDSELCQSFKESKTSFKTVTAHLNKNGYYYLGAGAFSAQVSSGIIETTLSTKYSAGFLGKKETLQEFKQTLKNMDIDFSKHLDRPNELVKIEKMKNLNSPLVPEFQSRMVKQDQVILKRIQDRLLNTALTNPADRLQLRAVMHAQETLEASPGTWLSKSEQHMAKLRPLIQLESQAIKSDLKLLMVNRGLRFLGSGLYMGILGDVAYNMICPEKVGDDKTEKSVDSIMKYPEALYGMPDKNACFYLDTYPGIAHAFKQFRDKQEDVAEYVKSIDPKIDEANKNSGLPVELIRGDSPVYDFSK